MYNVSEIRGRIDGLWAEPKSEEGQKEIHSGDTHVSEVWQDGEITTTKSGDLYGHRLTHLSEEGFLGDYQSLFPDYHDSPGDNVKMIVIDEELKSILQEYREFPISQEVMKRAERKYNVYELNGDGETNFIGTVRAYDDWTAKQRARQEYGGPIEVELND